MLTSRPCLHLCTLNTSPAAGLLGALEELLHKPAATHPACGPPRSTSLSATHRSVGPASDDAMMRIPSETGTAPAVGCRPHVHVTAAAAAAAAGSACRATPAAPQYAGLVPPGGGDHGLSILSGPAMAALAASFTNPSAPPFVAACAPPPGSAQPPTPERLSKRLALCRTPHCLR